MSLPKTLTTGAELKALNPLSVIGLELHGIKLGMYMVGTSTVNGKTVKDSAIWSAAGSDKTKVVKFTDLDDGPLGAGVIGRITYRAK